ncbi:MAG: glycogen synthase GlgA [Gemmataceae bacterium]
MTLDRPLRVLFMASEAAGFAKTGGLADVATALPRALHKRGIDVRVAIPCYNSARKAWRAPEPTEVGVDIHVGPHSYPGRVSWTYLPKSEVPIYLIEQQHFFERDDPGAGRGIYNFTDHGNKRDYPDNAERFVFFTRACLEMLPKLGFWPDVIHCNDWQTGLVPVYARDLYGRAKPEYYQPRMLLTIHNIAYQGQFSPSTMAVTNLDASLYSHDKLESHGTLNFLKAGIVYSDWINTVSPRYAEEIQTSAFGCGMESTLASRRHRLCGILNGVDYDDWNPATDPHLPAKFDVNNVFEFKPENKAALQRYFHLPEWPRTPMLGVVSRLAEQKGIELILEVAEQMIGRDVQFVILGEGDQHYHYWLQQFRDRYPQRVGVHFGFSDPLAHLIEAGADMFLMPSKYEPAGLNQLYSLRYGTVPIVRDVGGLHDTIFDTTESNLTASRATGFRFGLYNGHALLGAIDRAVHVYRNRTDVWKQLVQNGMRQDWSWDRSAGEYENLYRRMIGV